MTKKKKKKNSKITDKKVENKIVTKTIHKHSANCKIGKKIKNLTALSILLFGFSVGSLFVDTVQFFQKKGFSALALKSADIIDYDGSTWVRYDIPRVVVDVVVSDDCKEECEVIDDLLSNLRSEIPTLEAHRINISKSEYSSYAQNNKVTSIPAFIFDNSLESTDFYKKGELIFDKKENGKIYIKMDELNLKTIELKNGSDKENKDIDKEKKQDNTTNENNKIEKNNKKKSSAVSI